MRYDDNVSAAADGPILRCEAITKAFGGVNAVNGATFEVPRNKITALIGPNGAGKTTVVNLLSGALKIDTGKVHLGNIDITNMERYKIARLGLMRTFQLSRELSGLTVLENLLVAPKVQAGESLFNIFFRPRLLQREEKQNLERALEILQTYGLYALRDNRASDLSGGQKKLLEISRGVMASPSLFLLDEPMAGVNPALIEKIGGYILDMKAQGVTVLMIEHNLNVVERICDNVIVLAEGRTLATGKLSELRENKEVVTAYLGEIINAGPSH
ncbi:MAG: ABC transporter ATP-binding protein [Acidobacteriota bacterium]|nr:ABC transporter ATP-binding protein [Acidobacteriota bacterium]MDE3030498.1 ABC transporter ATP-binding protein [Acidobacteriota bacterium]MDE3093099.1 ABC transporter ATP-binding protein [Acidobacteriota bacterium]MDE3139635.1 ABC transporter ATP-binding protein [Acidobacteriota bacterium]MDE3146775.1 ABC transporter ATP-binding protein [Acidobacteriota bacterium]